MDYRKLGLTAFLVVIASMFASLIISNIPLILHWIGSIISILMPFIIAVIIAYLLHPLYKSIYAFCQRKNIKMAKTIAIVVPIVLLIGGIVVFFIMIIPDIASSISQLIESKFLTKLYNYITSSSLLKDYLGGEATQNFLNNNVLPFIQSFSSDAVNWMLSLAGTIYTSLKNLTIAVFAAIYIMADYEHMTSGIRNIFQRLLTPKAYGYLRYWASFISNTFSSFIRGKALDSLIIGVVSFAVITIAGIPYSLLISVIIGITNMIPVFGPFIGAIPGALLIVINAPNKLLFFIIFVIVLQQIDGNIIGPKILGDVTGVDPFWVLFSIIFFGGLFGVIGMLIGVPVFAIVEVIFKEIMHHLSPEKKEEI